MMRGRAPLAAGRVVVRESALESRIIASVSRLSSNKQASRRGTRTSEFRLTSFGGARNFRRTEHGHRLPNAG